MTFYKKFHNKKAQESSLRKIILNTILLLVLAFLIYFFFIKNFIQKTVTSCPEEEFCKNECDYSKEFRDNTKICAEDNKVCCKPINIKENPLSNECKGKSVGDYCGNKFPSGKDEPKVCNEYFKCVELCDFCADNPSNEKCKINQNDIIGTKIKSFNSNFRCGCAISECTATSKHTCIKNFCSTTDKNSGEYYCCNK